MTTTEPAGILSGFCGGPLHSYCPVVVAGHPCICDCHQQPEPEPVTVHCFFGCPHVVRDEDPTRAHDAMELHYRGAHWEQIRAAIGWVTA